MNVCMYNAPNLNFKLLFHNVFALTITIFVIKQWGSLPRNALKIPFILQFHFVINIININTIIGTNYSEIAGLPNEKKLTLIRKLSQRPPQ